MAANATLTVNVVADTASATKGLDNTTDAMNKMGREARTASDRIDDIGGTASGTTTGLRDMADAVEMAGFGGLATSMGIAATATEAIDGATTLYTTHSKLLTAALGKVNGILKLLRVTILTNPIFLIAAVILGIIAVFVILYNKCEGFRKVVDAVFGAVMSVIRGVWDWIKKNWPLLLAILAGPIGLFILVVVKNFDKIKAVISAVWNWIKDTWSKVYNFFKEPIEKAINWIKDAFENYIDKVKDIVQNIKDIFAGVFDAIKKPFEKAINWVKDHFKLPSLPSWLPGVGKATPGVYVPAPRVGGMAVGTQAAAGGITIVFNGPVGDPHAVTRQLRRLFRDDDARVGRRHPQPYGQIA